MSGFTNTPGDDPATLEAHRAIEAILREYGAASQIPRFVVMAEVPPDGRVGVASTGDNAIDTLRIAVLALGAAKAGVRAAGIDPDGVMASWAAEYRQTGRTP